MLFVFYQSNLENSFPLARQNQFRPKKSNGIGILWQRFVVVEVLGAETKVGQFSNLEAFEKRHNACMNFEFWRLWKIWRGAGFQWLVNSVGQLSFSMDQLLFLNLLHGSRVLIPFAREKQRGFASQSVVKLVRYLDWTDNRVMITSDLGRFVDDGPLFCKNTHSTSSKLS